MMSLCDQPNKYLIHPTLKKKKKNHTAQRQVYITFGYEDAWIPSKVCSTRTSTHANRLMVQYSIMLCYLACIDKREKEKEEKRGSQGQSERGWRGGKEREGGGPSLLHGVGTGVESLFREKGASVPFFWFFFFLKWSWQLLYFLSSEDPRLAFMHTGEVDFSPWPKGI